ncbi:MAG: hypothetical protein QNJ70_12000 [Xenococcaceae cyanobacterium MO_207.B15]|nr:hypothetical protein [Xenococcaceae cyanobacterium MO_207.B15]
MSQSTYKAERRTIYLGDIPLEIAMLPNGDYCLSQTQVAAAIDKDQNSIRRFYASKYFKAISDNGFELDHFQEKLVLEGSNKPINPVSIDVAYLYWQKWAVAGNKKAQQLCLALGKHSLYDLADAEFNIKRTKEAKNQAFKQNLNSDPTACLEDFEQNPDNVLKFPSKETSNNRELELLIELAQLGLEKIKSPEHLYDPREVRKLGAFKPEVLIDIKDKLKLKTTEEAKRFLEIAGFGKDSGKWVDIKVSGSMSVLSWNSVKELRKICSKTLAKQNKIN